MKKKIVDRERSSTRNRFKEGYRGDESLFTDSLNKTKKEDHVVEPSKKSLLKNSKEGKPLREVEGPICQFIEYTPLTVSWDMILVEISSTDFKEAGMKYPKVTTLKAIAYKIKYCAIVTQ